MSRNEYPTSFSLSSSNDKLKFIEQLRRYSNRPGGTTQLQRKLDRATNLLKFFAIALELRMFRQRCSYFAKNARRVFVWWFSQTIMQPLAFASSSDHSRPAQVGKMPRDLRLTYFQNLYQKANTHFRFADKINQPQTRAICQRAEKIFEIVFVLCHFNRFLPSCFAVRAESCRARRRSFFRFVRGGRLREIRSVDAGPGCQHSREISRPATSRFHFAPIH